MFWRRKIRNREERLCRAGLYVSGLIHSSVVAAIIGCRILGVDIPVIDAMTGHAKSIVVAEYWQHEEFADVTQVVDNEVRQLIQPKDGQKTVDERLRLSPAGEPQVASTPPAIATESVSVESFVKSRVDRATEEAAKLDDEQKQARLAELSQKLSEVSTEESIGELANKFQKWLGTEKRAEKPAAKPEGSFDFASAQLHDVRREGSEEAGYTYTSILIDAAGRTMDAPMGKEDGENLYRTMQLIKSNPLLEKVYRGIVMGLLDKMLKPEPENK